MDDLVLKVKFGLKTIHKKPAPDPLKRAEVIKIFDQTIKVSNVGILTLKKEMQTLLKCNIGEEITYKNPFTKINKIPILRNLETQEIIEEFEPFIPYKQYLSEYPENEILLIQAVDELREEDDFYLCWNLDEANQILNEIRNIINKQEQKISNAVHKKAKTWKSLGSEHEVDANIPKKSRGLYKIELYTKYPIKNKQHIRLELAGSKKFDHTDLTIPEKYKKEIVLRKRIDAEVQTKPITLNKDAQTNYNYPKNTWTQYEYNYSPVEVVGFPNEEFGKKCIDLRGEMLVNSNLNLYTDDYSVLGKRDFKNGGDVVRREEYMSIIDVESKGKVVTDFVWHPLISGILAVAYGCESNLVNKNCSPFYKEKPVYDEFRVLIWDINDTFHPKLKLECDSEIQTLSFCATSKNILIGGGRNGQIFYWNLHDKLNSDSNEKLNVKQKCNRDKIYAIMQWKDRENTPILPISAKSDFGKGHRGCVTGTSWILEKNREFGFMTASTDGFIKFWDLNAIVYGEVEYQVSGVIKKKIGALNPYFSKKLFIFGIKITYPVSTILQPRYDFDFTEVTQSFCLHKETAYRKITNNFERINRNLNTINFNPNNKIFLISGTNFGDLITSSWEDEKEDDDVEVDKSLIQILNMSKLHDGPINSIEQHPDLEEFYLTTGGKVFVIWKILENTLKPVFWRRSKYFYTHGHWSLYQATAFRLNRSDGNREIWDLSIKSDSFHYLNNYSGKSLLKAAVHPFKIPNNVFGLSDDQGSLRLVYVPDGVKKAENRTQMRVILENNFEIKNSFSAWQTSWNEKYAAHLIEDRKRAELDKIRKEKEAHKARIRLKEKLAREAVLKAQLAELKKRPPPGKKAEWAHKKWLDNEHKTLSKLMLDKKKLNRETLKEDRRPVQVAHNEKVRLLIKKREKFAEAGVIFKKTIDALFPEISGCAAVKEVEVVVDKAELFKENMEAYEKIGIECKKFLHENPYVSQINWNKALKNLGLKKKDRDCASVKGRRFKIKSEIFNNSLFKYKQEGNSK